MIKTENGMRNEQFKIFIGRKKKTGEKKIQKFTTINESALGLICDRFLFIQSTPSFFFEVFFFNKRKMHMNNK